jgi:hypothetical protein
MKIEFIEDINLALRKSINGRVIHHRRFKSGNVQNADFIGEDSDLNFIDFQLADGGFAIKVPRFAVAVTK